MFIWWILTVFYIYEKKIYKIIDLLEDKNAVSQLYHDKHNS